MSSLHYNYFGIITALFLSGCMASPQYSELQQYLEKEKIKQEKLQQIENDKSKEIDDALDNKIAESNLSYGTADYVAYQYGKSLLNSDYSNSLQYIDEKIKKYYYEKVINLLEISIKYKYYEPIYDIFGKNIGIDQIRKIPTDKLLSSFIKLSIRRNYKASKIELAFAGNQGNASNKEIRLIGREFISLVNHWNNVEMSITLSEINGTWTVTNDNWLINHIKKEIVSMDKCQGKSFQRNSYTENLALLNKKVCINRAQQQKVGTSEIQNPLSQLSGLLIPKTFEEISRDEIFNNQDCMNFINGKGISLTKDIVSDETCKQLNITVENVPLSPKKQGPSIQALQHFFFNNGGLICRKEGTNVDTLISKKTGWYDWKGTEIRHEDNPEEIKFYFTECRDPQ